MGATVSGGDLTERIDRLAAGLMARGFGAEDVVGRLAKERVHAHQS